MRLSEMGCKLVLFVLVGEKVLAVVQMSDSSNIRDSAIKTIPSLSSPLPPAVLLLLLYCCCTLW